MAEMNGGYYYCTSLSVIYTFVSTHDNFCHELRIGTRILSNLTATPKVRKYFQNIVPFAALFGIVAHLWCAWSLVHFPVGLSYGRYSALQGYVSSCIKAMNTGNAGTIGSGYDTFTIRSPAGLISSELHMA